jgi:hypothetical protein
VEDLLLTSLLSVLPVFACRGGLVRARAVSFLAPSKVLVGGLDPRLLGGDDDPSPSAAGAGDPEASSLPMNVHRFLFGAVVEVASIVRLLLSVTSSVESVLFNEVNDCLLLLELLWD